MKAKLFFLIIILMALCYSGIVYAGEEITLTTYYPAPYGEYNSLSVGDPTAGYTATSPGVLLVQGNVGIGTTDPRAKLDIFMGTKSHVTFDSAMYNPIDGDNYTNMWYDETDDVAHIQSFTNNVAYRDLILNNYGGNVGIGTTTPGSPLDISADATMGDSETYMQLNLAGSTSTAERLILGYDTTANVGIIQAVTTAVSYDDLALNPNGGNVGIGTTSPGTNRLKVVGGPTETEGGLIIETRDATQGDPASPETGRMWLRTDL